MASRRALESLEETAPRRQGDRDRAAERRLKESLEAAARRHNRRDRALKGD